MLHPTNQYPIAEQRDSTDDRDPPRESDTSNHHRRIAFLRCAIREGRRMRYSNFLFPDSPTPADDGRVIDETLQEARLTDQLGFVIAESSRAHGGDF